MHTCTCTLLLSDPGLLLAETPAVASAAAVVFLASSLFLEGDVQVGRKSAGEPELASSLLLRMHPGQEAGF